MQGVLEHFFDIQAENLNSFGQKQLFFLLALGFFRLENKLWV